MPTECENCKANPVDILTSLKGADLSDKAKLVAILEAFGVTDREQVESILEAKASTIRDARRALKIQRQKSVSDGNPAPEIRRTDENPSQTTEIQRRNSSDSSRAHATKESLRDKSYLEVNKIPPTPQSEVGSVRFADGRLALGPDLRKFWLAEFGDDAKRLDLALIEVGGRIQPNSSRSIEVQVSSQLARIAADKRDRDTRYQSAAIANAAKQSAAKPLRVSRW